MLRPKFVRLAGILSAGVALTLTLSACAGSGDSGDGDTIKLGFMGDLTGENSGIVIPPRDGAKLAIDEYNKTNPEKKIELVEYDSQGKEEQATSLVRKATTQDKIAGLIGPAFSGESKAAGPLLERAKVPSVSPSATNPELAQNGWKYWHRVVANDADQGPGIVDFLVKAKAPKKAFVVSDDQDYSVGLAKAAADAFTAKGVAVETNQFEKDESDYSTTVNAARASGADVIFFGGYYAQGGRLLKQLRDGGVTGLFATGDGSLDAQLVSGAGEQAAEGAVIGCPCNIPFGDVSDQKELNDFKTKFKEATGNDPAIYASEGYDAATLFINAIKDGKTDSESINEYLKTVDLKNGVSKPIKFKENGEPEANEIFVYEVIDGAIASLGPSTEAKLEG
jgi:branched-chain amino acid transport system substrate-binding protein